MDPDPTEQSGGDRAKQPATRPAGELRVLRDEVALSVPPPSRPLRPAAGRVLHVLAAPAERRGDTVPWLRSLAEVERDHGLDPIVVTEMGFRSERTYAVEERDGILHHRIPGAERTGPAGERWLVAQTTRLAAVVRKVRPAVLVAAGEHPVPQSAVAVGRAYGIPVVVDLTPADPPTAAAPSEVDALLARAEDRIRDAADEVVDAAMDRVLGHLDAYERVGVLEPGARVIAALAPRPEDLERLRQHVTGSRTLRPLERGMRARSFLADETMEQGWVEDPLPRVSLQHPVRWTSMLSQDRSHAFHLHAWTFMSSVLGRYTEGGQDRYLRWCVELAVSWCRTFTAGDGAGTMAWYDMALALRAPRLAFLLQETLRLGYDHEVTSVLHAAAVRHQQEIHRAAAFAPHNNHGFYTAVGQLALARRLPVLPGMAELDEQGTARLRTVVATQFADDGGHLEHSPDYHRMLVDSYVAAMDEGLVDDREVVRRVHAAQRVMGWFIRPDQTLLQVGDTSERMLSRSAPSMAEAATAFVATAGEVGSPASETLKVLPSSGYAIVRSPQPVGRDDHLEVCYLTLMAGFHSRTHKHADDLSLTWFDRGHELLLDAGRFGYVDALPADSPDRLAGFFYSRPERQYVESTRAHNTVAADDCDHERRDRSPYGSALLDAQQQDGRYRIRAEVDHAWWRHRREVALRPGSWLRVRDEVTATDGRLHDFRVWWNLPHELAWQPAGDRAAAGASATFAAADGTRLTITSLDGAELVDPVAGQRQPLRGWRSRVDREFTPAWSLGFAVLRRSHHVFDTLLRLGDDDPDEPDPGAAR